MKDALGNVQSVLVLGGGSDIARAVTLALARERARTVVLAGRDTVALEPVAAEIRAAGATTVATEAFDALDTAAHAAFVERVWSAHGDFDVVLLAWGVLDGEPVHVAATNYLGAVSVGALVGERLRAQGHGTLVALSSVAGERPRRSNYPYGSSKAGFDAFFTGLGDDLHGSGASVLVVRPGFVHSKMTAGMKPAPLATTPDKVAEAVVAGLRRGSETIWVPGPLRYVMAVLRHLPRVIFRRLPI